MGNRGGEGRRSSFQSILGKPIRVAQRKRKKRKLTPREGRRGSSISLFRTACSLVYKRTLYQKGGEKRGHLYYHYNQVILRSLFVQEGGETTTTTSSMSTAAGWSGGASQGAVLLSLDRGREKGGGLVPHLLVGKGPRAIVEGIEGYHRVFLRSEEKGGASFSVAGLGGKGAY